MVFIFVFGGGAALSQSLHLEIQPVWGDHGVIPTQTPALKGDSAISIERFDFLLSKLAIRREDGTWVDSKDWFGFFSLEKGRWKAKTEGLPAGKYSAIRFEVGVPAAQDEASPEQWPADHPLHPDVSGLHWGWQGGYVFMALEGHWLRPDGELGGFSYHLAKAPNMAQVEIPVVFQGGGPVTVKLVVDVSNILRDIDFVRDGTSTHSRDGDPLAARFRDRLSDSFHLLSVHQDAYQTAEPGLLAEKPVTGTHPYPLAITQRFPQVRLPADNPLTQEGVALGERLFHDPRLSINNSQSCASCHDRSNAFTDSRVLSLGAEGQAGKRHAMPLFNLAWASSYFWDGRATTLREQVLMPIQDQHEMNESLDRVAVKIDDAKEDFKAAFGTTEINSDRIAKALEQYLLSLISQESRFDRAVRKVAQMSEQEKQGLQLFVTEYDPARGLRGADCFHCHGGTLFTDHQFKNNGLDRIPSDKGRMGVTGNSNDNGKFKTPSLRNVAVSAPYMHDGRFATLEEVVEHYNSGVKRSDTLDPNLAKHPDTGLNLTTQEKAALVAFLKTLTDEAFIAGPAKPQIAQRP